MTKWIVFTAQATHPFTVPARGELVAIGKIGRQLFRFNQLLDRCRELP